MLVYLEYTITYSTDVSSIYWTSCFVQITFRLYDKYCNDLGSKS